MKSIMQATGMANLRIYIPWRRSVTTSTTRLIVQPHIRIRPPGRSRTPYQDAPRIRTHPISTKTHRTVLSHCQSRRAAVDETAECGPQTCSAMHFRSAALACRVTARARRQRAGHRTATLSDHLVPLAAAVYMPDLFG